MDDILVKIAIHALTSSFYLICPKRARFTGFENDNAETLYSSALQKMQNKKQKNNSSSISHPITRSHI